MNLDGFIAKNEQCGGKIYIREADGTSYQTQYLPDKQFLTIFLQIYQRQLPPEAVVICRGKIVDVTKSLVQNQISPNQIVNIRRKIVKTEQLPQNFTYVSYKDKLYAVDFHEQDSVKELKTKIEQQVKVPMNKQIILFNGSFLDESNMLRDYNIKNEDILKLGRVQENSKQVYFTQRSFPIKISSRNRRGSEGQYFVENTAQNWQNFSQFANSSIQTQTKPQQGQKTQSGAEISFSPSSQIFEESDCPNFNAEAQQWTTTKSEQGDSPVVDKFSDLNIFSQKNVFEISALDFPHQGNIQSLNCEESENLFDKNKAQFNLETAFNDLLEAQKVVLCQSYYQKEQPNSPIPNYSAEDERQSFTQIKKKTKEEDEREGKQKLTEEKTEIEKK